MKSMSEVSNELFHAAKRVLQHPGTLKSMALLQEAVEAYNQTQCENIVEAIKSTNSPVLSAHVSKETASKNKQIEIQQAHIDDQDQLIFDQTKEIADLKENINRLIEAHMGAEKEVSELKEEIDRLKKEVERLTNIGHTPESEMNELSTRELIERLIASQLKVEKLGFMIEHGLGPEDMVNDITMPHEI